MVTTVEKKAEVQATCGIFTGTMPAAELTLGSSGIHLLNKQTAILDEKLARRMLEYPALAYERPLRDHHVEDLVKAGQDGTFRWELVTLAYATLKDMSYRINGQHTSWARIMTPTLEGPVTVLHYKVDSTDDLRILYGSFDRAAARTRGHVTTARLLGTELMGDLGSRSIALITQGYAVWKWDTSHKRVGKSPEEVAHRMQTEDAQVTKRLVAAWRIDGRPLDSDTHMRRASVVAAMFATFDVLPAKAHEFWEAVRTGVGLHKGDPRLKLRNELTNSRLLSNRGGDDRKKITAEVVYHWCVHAWNAWRRGLPLTRFVVKSEKRPRVLVRPKNRIDEEDAED